MLISDWPTALPSITDANVSDYNLRHYHAMITAMDDAVGMVMRAAKHADMWHDSLLFFCSDNGARLGDSTGSNHPYRGGKFTLWEGGTRILAFLSGPLVTAHRASDWHGMAHASDVLPTLLRAAGIASLPQEDELTPFDGFNLWDAIMHNRSSPRREVLHNLLTRWNHRDCRGSDLDEENCGAGIRVGKFKLLAGYPGDSRWSEAGTSRPRGRARATVPRGPQMPWDWKGLGTAAWRATRKDGCTLSNGIGCPCWRGYCLFDLEADPGERTDLSARLPHVVKRLRARLEQASLRGTQGAHLCHAAGDAAKQGLAAVLKLQGAYLPYVNESTTSAWRDDRTERSCYNPCPLRVVEPQGPGRTSGSVTAFGKGVPAWCATLDAATPAV